MTLLTDAPAGAPLVISASNAGDPVLVSVVNAVATDPPAEFMTGWQFRLVIVPDAAAAGRLQFNVGAKPTPYVFDSVGNLGAPSATVNGVFSALDTAIPTNVGVQIPPAPGANLQLITLTPSADAAGTFGIYAKNSPDTYWIDAASQSREFVNVPGGPAAVRIADVLVSPAGDFDENAVVDAVDIDILWKIVRTQNLASDPNGDDTADLNGDTFMNEDDVDTMLASKLTAGGNRAYGDANLSGGPPELTDYNLWRTGTGGWAKGDFDGSGGVPELNDYNLWRTGPTQFPTTVGSHGGGGGGLVPEPSSFLLVAIACAFGVVWRLNRRESHLRGPM